MRSAEGNGGSQPAGWLSHAQKLWFPTIRGYAAITPPAAATFLPPAVIEQVKINNKIIETETAVQIGPEAQNLEINYTGLSFTASKQLRFRYKLEGFDTVWTEAGTRRTAYYSHPPAGDYIFTVEAANADGAWNEQGAKLRLIILPPFYQTRMFYALIAAFFIGIGLLIYSLRVSNLKRAGQIQEAWSRRLIQFQEEERQRIAADLHDSLSQNLVIIKNRARISLAGRQPLESVFEQIEEIADAADESLAQVREIAANLRPFQIDRLGLTKAV